MIDATRVAVSVAYWHRRTGRHNGVSLNMKIALTVQGTLSHPFSGKAPLGFEVSLPLLRALSHIPRSERTLRSDPWSSLRCPFSVANISIREVLKSHPVSCHNLAVSPASLVLLRADPTLRLLIRGLRFVRDLQYGI